MNLIAGDGDDFYKFGDNFDYNLEYEFKIW